MDVINGPYAECGEFFDDVLKLLSDYRWIYEFRNTDILIHRVVERVPKHWIPILQLESLHNIQTALKGESQPSWPDDLTELVSRCRRVSLRVDNSLKEDVDLKWKKVNPKKIHEVVNFSQIIGETCAEKGVRHVVDIGSGLGYLDKELSERWNVHVLGLERDGYRVLAANRRAETTATQHGCRATFKELTVNDNENTLNDQVESVVSDWMGELRVNTTSPPGLCMIGLHSCGDLSPTMMKLFLNNRRYRALLLVSCCYHRMEWSIESDNNFPLSQCLKRKSSGSSTPFHQHESIPHLLRLAAQETPNQWMGQDASNQRRQAHNTFYRAVIQLYSVQEGIQLIKQHRRPVKKSDVSSDFNDYINQAIEGFGLLGDASSHREKLIDLYRRSEPLLSALGTLIILQVLFQPVAESLILIDRLVYLKESGTVNASLRQLFNDRISPRCFVLTADKLPSDH